MEAGYTISRGLSLFYLVPQPDVNSQEGRVDMTWKAIVKVEAGIGMVT